jgi:hypothetical protein
VAVAGEARLSPQLLSGRICSVTMWFTLKAKRGRMCLDAPREPSLVSTAMRFTLRSCAARCASYAATAARALRSEEAGSHVASQFG